MNAEQVLNCISDASDYSSDSDSSVSDISSDTDTDDSIAISPVPSTSRGTSIFRRGRPRGNRGRRSMDTTVSSDFGWTEIQGK